MRLDEITQQPGQLEIIQRDAIMEMLRVAIPGIVETFDADSCTATIRPAIRDRHKSESPPVLQDVPVYFPGKFTYEVNAGDECLVVFADACIDGWFEHGGIASPVSARRHDLSDGFAIIGFRSRASTKEKISLEGLFAGIDARFEVIESRLDEMDRDILKHMTIEELDYTWDHFAERHPDTTWDDIGWEAES